MLRRANNSVGGYGIRGHVSWNVAVPVGQDTSRTLCADAFPGSSREKSTINSPQKCLVSGRNRSKHSGSARDKHTRVTAGHCR